MRAKGASGYLALSAACLVFLGSMGVLTVRAVQMKHQPMPLEMGQVAPGFELNDGRGHAVSSGGLRGNVTVLFFAAEKCPVSANYVDRVHRLASLYRRERVRIIRVDVGSEKVLGEELADEAGMVRFVDRDGSVAGKFGVTVAPTFCLIDAGGHLRYSGAFDDGRNGSQAKQRYLPEAVRRVVKGMPVGVSSTQAFGCAISLHPN